MNVITELGVGLIVISLITYNLIAKCIQHTPSSNPQPRTQANYPDITAHSATLWQRFCTLFSEKVFNPTLLTDQILPQNIKCFTDDANIPIREGIRQELVRMYPSAIDPIGDGNCGPLTMLAILSLSAESDNTIRKNILNIIDKYCRTLHSSFDINENTAHEDFNDTELLKQGLKLLKNVFSSNKSLYPSIKDLLNHNKYAYENVCLAFRYICYQLHISDSNNNNHKQLNSDILDFIRINTSESEAPKTWISEDAVLSTLKFFIPECIPPLYAFEPSEHLGRDCNGNEFFNCWLVPNGKTSTDSPFCIIVNNRHFQLLTKINPDQPRLKTQ